MARREVEANFYFFPLSPFLDFHALLPFLLLLLPILLSIGKGGERKREGGSKKGNLLQLHFIPSPLLSLSEKLGREEKEKDAFQLCLRVQKWREKRKKEEETSAVWYTRKEGRRNVFNCLVLGFVARSTTVVLPPPLCTLQPPFSPELKSSSSSSFSSSVSFHPDQFVTVEFCRGKDGGGGKELERGKVMKSRGEGKKKNETGILSSPVCVRSGEKGDLKAIFIVSLQQRRKKKKVGGRREVTHLAIPPSALRVRFVLRIREESVSFAMMSLPRSSFFTSDQTIYRYLAKEGGEGKGGKDSEIALP